jgi:hypothetical protein
MNVPQAEALLALALVEMASSPFPYTPRWLPGDLELHWDHFWTPADAGDESGQSNAGGKGLEGIDQQGAGQAPSL